jgi:hypothetical protein
MTAKTAALVIGLLFLAVGILGFVNNPIVGESKNALFHADGTHNMVHIISGALFVLVSQASHATARSFMIFFGLVYLAIGIIGMLNTGNDGMTKVLGLLHVNSADNYLHIGLGAVILLAALASRRTMPVA